MSSEERNLGLQLSRRGQRLASGNSYFDWMAARYLFAARRDGEAVAALIDASHKLVFDDYRDDLWRVEIRCLSRPSPLLAEQKLTLRGWCIPRDRQILSHTTKMALWAAMQRWEAGDEARALEIEGALVRLHLLRYRHGEPAIDWAKPIHDTVLVWQAPFYMRRAQALSTSQGQLRHASSARMIHSYASTFAAYARDNGREDLARESTTAAKKWASLWQLGSRTWGPYFSLLHGKGADAQIQLSWFAVQLAGIQGVVALGLWTFFSIFGPLRRPRGADITHFGPRVVFYPVLIGGVISLSFAVGCHLVICQDWQLLTHSDYIFVLSMVTIAAPFVLSTLTCLCATTWAVKGTPSPQLVKRPLSFRELLQLSAWQRMTTIFWRLKNFLWFRTLPIVLAFFLQFSILSLLKIRFLHGLFGDFDLYFQGLYWSLEDTETMVTGLLITTAMYLCATLIRWRFDLPQHLRPVIYAGFFAYRRILGWTIPLSLWFMLAALVTGTFPRAQLEAHIAAILNSQAR